MAGLLIDALDIVWESDTSGLWSVGIKTTSSRFGDDGFGMEILACSGTTSDPAPFVQKHFSTPLDLRDYNELRFWLRSSHPGDGSEGKPFYLAFNVEVNPPNPSLSWERLLPVKQRGSWELQKLYIEDMPTDLRKNIGLFRIRSLDPTIAFTASMDNLIASISEPLQDVDAELIKRLNNRFQVIINTTPTSVPAILNLPEKQPTSSYPYILIRPWSIKPNQAMKMGSEIIDNYKMEGAFVHNSSWLIDLEFCIDVFADERLHKVILLEQILRNFRDFPYLVVNNELLHINAFISSPEDTAHLIPPGRTPLFYRVTVPVESIERQFRPMAVPYILTAPKDGLETSELTTV